MEIKFLRTICCERRVDHVGMTHLDVGINARDGFHSDGENGKQLCTTYIGKLPSWKKMGFGAFSLKREAAVGGTGAAPHMTVWTVSRSEGNTMGEAAVNCSSGGTRCRHDICHMAAQDARQQQAKP